MLLRRFAKKKCRVFSKTLFEKRVLDSPKLSCLGGFELCYIKVRQIPISLFIKISLFWSEQKGSKGTSVKGNDGIEVAALSVDGLVCDDKENDECDTAYISPKTEERGR